MPVHALDDTIAAIATAPGQAGLAVVRVSGPGAIAAADRVFDGAAPLAVAATHTLHHGWAVWPADSTTPAPALTPAMAQVPGNRIDEVVAAVFRAPRSYTREDVVELSCHGGRLPATRVLEALVGAGARLAAAGEFSLRAFLNGRIDLAQAEAVVDVIQAETEAARALAVAQLAGELSRRLRAITGGLNDVLAEIEARVDFAEDVGGVEVPPHALAALESAAAELTALLAHASYARAVREGARIPIVGRPNVGKSSLFNALLGEERALVTELPGTTRDRVSESVEFEGVRVTLSDTAGIREQAERVEALGIAHSEAALAESPLAIWVVDASQPLDSADLAVAALLRGKRVVVALNKRDLPAAVTASAAGAVLAASGVSWWRATAVSAMRREGLASLHEALLDALGAGQGAALGAAVSNARHVEALERARSAFARAIERGCAGAPGEIVAIELREGLAAVGEVTGEGVDPDLLERIFGRFCIGK